MRFYAILGLIYSSSVYFTHELSRICLVLAYKIHEYGLAFETPIFRLYEASFGKDFANILYAVMRFFDRLNDKLTVFQQIEAQDA